MWVDRVVLEQESGARAAVGDQPGDHGGAGAQWRRPVEHPLLELAVGVVEQRGEDARPAAETPEDGSLAQLGPLGQCVHGEPPHAAFGDHLAGDLQQVFAVAGGVGTLGGRRPDGQQGGGVHGHTVAEGI
jgi:hypothetical protein